jgi:hypothetical protein
MAQQVGPAHGIAGNKGALSWAMHRLAPVRAYSILARGLPAPHEEAGDTTAVRSFPRQLESHFSVRVHSEVAMS